MKLKLFLGFMLACSFVHAAAVTGLETPVFKSSRELELDKDVDPPKPSSLNCYVFPRFAVVEINKPSLKGSEKIEVRPRENEESQKVLCEKNFRGPHFELKHQGGYFLGALRNFLVVDCADTHGGRCFTEIFDAKTGGKLVEESYQSLAPAEMKTKGKNVEFTFSRVLTQKSNETCFPEKDRQCWNEILKENKVPKSVKLSVPDCAKLFEKDPATRQQFSTMFSVPAKLTLPKDQTSHFVSGEARCWLNP